MALFSGGTEMINAGSLLVGGIPTGTVVPWTDSTVATGFLECNGAAVSRSTYSALFAVIGTTYGAGDGSSTFNLPDLQDEVVVGKSNNKALASTGGANTTPVAPAGNVSTNINVTGNVGGSTGNASLSTSQLASHSHSIPTRSSPPNDGSPYKAAGQIRGFDGPTPNTGSAGSGNAHSHNMSANFSGSGNASSNFSGTTVNPSILQPYLTLIYIIKT
jgi:microcystin-dependent protein|tara:strand:+ start:13 stop:663 length:651 start_codon:yes stop_codon:yes gene_type:complete